MVSSETGSYVDAVLQRMPEEFGVLGILQLLALFRREILCNSVVRNCVILIIVEMDELCISSGFLPRFSSVSFMLKLGATHVFCRA